MVFYTLAAVGKDLECFVLSKHATAYTHRENYLNNISSKIKIQCGPATQTVSTSSFSWETNTIIKLEGRGGGGQTFGFTGNKKPVEEQRRTTLSDERQTQLPTIPPSPPPTNPPPSCQGLTEAFVRVHSSLLINHHPQRRWSNFYCQTKTVLVTEATVTDRNAVKKS